MSPIDSTSRGSFAQRLVRRILLASAVIAGASCADHKAAQRAPQPVGNGGYDPYTAAAPRTAQAAPTSPAPTPTPTPPGGDEGSNRGGAGSQPGARDAGAPPNPSAPPSDAGSGPGPSGPSAPTGPVRDAGAPRGNPRDGGPRSF
jgi:hypothetical protein